MNIELITAVKDAIYQAVSATTDQLYLLWLPDFELLDRFTVVYEVQKEGAIATFDNPEFIKRYSVDVKVNCRDVNQFAGHSETIKSKIFGLRGVNCKTVAVEGEEFVFNDEYQTYTEFLRFRVQV